MVQPKYNPQEALERVKLMMNYDLSKTSTENKKVIEEQTQPNSDPYSCIINFFQANRNLFSGIGQRKNPEYGLYELLVTLKMSNLTWIFSNWNDGKKTWIQYKNGIYGELTDTGLWSCNGDSNFTMESTVDGLNFKSNNFKQFFSQSQPAQPAQDQPAQPAQDQPKSDKKQDTPDPSKPQKLKPKDSPLGTTLKDTSIPKRSCVVYVDQLFEAWERSRGQKFDTNQINELRGYVQRCMDDHFPSGSKQGNWGITGLGGGKTDQKLLQLSACKSPAPSQSGPDSIFRLTRKC
tara:strand:+ start:2270 stop:3142 length:873 start_codon:yes stop_codon:yes gene_type:complete